MAKNVFFRLALYGAAIITLFYNGARSELIVLIPAALTIEGYLSRGKVIAMILASFVLLFFADEIINALINAFPDNRVVWLLRDFSFDQSYMEREWVQQYALEIIGSSPIFGSFGYYQEGLYAHNILSVWADLGIFGLLLFATGLIAALIYVVRNFHAGERDVETLTLACFTVSAIVFFAFAKAYSHPIFGIALALLARHLVRRMAPPAEGRVPAIHPTRLADSGGAAWD
jgi:hypothetical protein